MASSSARGFADQEAIACTSFLGLNRFWRAHEVGAGKTGCKLLRRETCLKRSLMGLDRKLSRTGTCRALGSLVNSLTMYGPGAESEEFHLSGGVDEDDVGVGFFDVAG